MSFENSEENSILSGPYTTTLIQEDEGNSYNCIVGKDMWFYSNLHNPNKPSKYESLLEEAKNRVYIWDPYTKVPDEELFKHINQDIEVKCLTLFEGIRMSNSRNSQYTSWASEFISNLANIKSEKGFQLELRVYNVDHRYSEKYGFHDRYLFIDEDIYVIGSSMPYHNLQASVNQKSTCIYKLTDDMNKHIIEQMFNDYWRVSEEVGV